MKRRILNCLACILAFVAGLVTLFLLSPPGRELCRTRYRMRELSNSQDVRDVAAGCLSLLQSITEQTVIAPASKDCRVPAVIRSKKPHSVIVDPSRQIVLIEFGGGFYHYGYRLEPTASAPAQWRLSLYGEAENDNRELLRL